MLMFVAIGINSVLVEGIIKHIRIALFLAIAATTGCGGASPVTMQKVATVQIAPLPEYKSDKPKFFVLRPEQLVLRGASVVIYENEKIIGSLGAGSILVWESDAGEKAIYGKKGKLKTCFVLSFKCINSKEGLLEPAYESSIADTNKLKVMANHGEKYYFRLNMKYFSTHDYLEAISQEETQSILLKKDEKSKLELFQ